MKKYQGAIVDGCLWLSAMLVATFVVLTTPNIAQAQSASQAAQTAGQLLDALGGIPGLDNLPVSGVQVESDHTSATVTLHGEDVTIVGFTVDGQKMAAVIPASFALTTFTPIPSGTPLDDVAFSNMAFVIVPSGGAKTGVTVTGLPTQVSAALSPTGSTIDLKAGLNLFGEVDVTGSTIETMLSPIGVTELKLPLNGGFPTSLFSQNPKTAAVDFKNQIMDNLSLSLPLPKLAIPGVPDAVSINNSAVSIAGQNDNGARTLEVDVAGDLDVAAAGKTVAFDFDLDVIKTTGSGTDLHFTGASTPGEILSVSLMETYSVSDLNIDVKRTSGKWNWQVHGETSFRSQTVDVSYQSNKTLLVSAQMTLADIVGSPSLPGLDDIKSNWIYILPGSVRVDMDIKGVRADLDIYKPDGSDKYYLGFAMGDFSPTAFIPDTANTPLQDVTFKDLAFVYKPTPTTETVTLTDLPDEIQFHLQTLETRLGTNNTSFTLKQGLNVFGEMDVTAAGEVKTLLKQVGIPENAALPIKGTFSKQVFKGGKKSPANIKNEILDNLNLHIPLPSISVPGIPGAVDIKQTNLTLTGKNDNGTRSIEIDLKGALDITHGSTNAEFDFDIDVVKKSGVNKLLFTATEVPGSTITLSTFETLTLTNLSFGMDNYKPGGWTTWLDGDGTFNNNAIHVNYVKDPGQSNYYAQITTKGMTLAKLINSPGLPGLDDVELDSVEVWPSRIFMHGAVDKIGAYFEVQKAPSGTTGHFISAYLYDFSLASLIPGTSSSPLKDVTFSNLVAVYNPATVSSSLGASGLGGNALSWVEQSNPSPTLKSGLNIFGHMNMTPSGEMANMLKEVGVTEVKLPLNGKIDKSMFHGSPSASIKNAILDNLDINLPLPAVKIPGLPDTVALKQTDLHIQGKNDKGTRSIDVAFTGQLDVSHGSSSADFNFDLDVDKASGQKAKMKFTADEVPGSSLTISMVETLTLSNMSFNMDNYTNGAWASSLTADSTLNGTSIHLSYVKPANQEYRVDITPKDLTLAKLIDSPGLPGLDDVVLNSVQIYPGFFFLHGTFKGQGGYLQVQPNPYGKGHYIAAYMYDMNLASLVPDSSSTPLKDVDFSNLVLFYSPVTTPVTLANSHLIGDAGAWILQSNTYATIQPGLNIFGHLNVKPGGEMKAWLGKVGVSEVKFPLNGKIDKSMFHGNPTAVIKNQIMANLDLKLNLPTPNIPGIDKALTFHNGKMEIKGQLPDGTQGVALNVSGDADVKFGSSDTLAFDVDVTYDRASGGTEKELKVVGTTTAPWDDPFDMDWIDLTSLSITFDETTKDGEQDWDVAVNATTTIGGNSEAVTVNVVEQNGALTDATFTLDGPLNLADIPGIKDIPEVKGLSVTSLTASKHGIDAKTTFNGKQTDFFAFEYESEWVIALEQNDFTLTEIVPPLKDTPLKHIVLSEAAVVLTQQQVSGTLSDFGPVAQDAFKTIYGQGQDAQVKLDQGLNLVAAFEHSKATGSASGGFKKMGMNQNRVVLVGGIGGILGNSNPHVDLSVVLDSHGRPSSMPSWMKFADNIDFIFSIIALESGDDFDVEIGIAMDVNTKIHDDELTFGGKLALEMEEEKADIKFIMSLKNGDLNDGGNTDMGLNCSLTNTPSFKPQPGPAGWHDPFGIPGFTLYDVMMDLGVTDDGVHLGFAGGAKIGGDRFCVAGDADLDAAELGLPQDIAFIGAADKVDMEFPENLAIQVATDLSKKAGLGVSKKDIEAISVLMNGLPQPVYKKVKFAFVTPGATDPDLKIQGEGVALRGIMSWLGKDLGSVDMAVGPKIGIKVDGTIGDPKPDGTAGNLTLGPIEFKDTYLDFQVPMPPKNPLNGFFKLNADLEVPLIDIDEKIKVDVTNKNLSFSVTNTLFKDFSETITMDLTGVDLSVTHPSIANADFAMSGALKADFGTFIETSMKATLNTAFTELNAKYAKGKAKVKAAEAKVNKLNGEINHERAVVRAERAKVEHKLEAAQDKVNDIKADIKHDWHKYHHCGGWFPWPCKIRWGITIGFEKAAKDIADEVLKLVEELVKHFPIDLDPRIWPLIAAKETAMGVLKLAEYSIDGLEDLDNLLTKGLDAIENAVGGSVNLKKASFNGSLTGVIEHNDPVDLLIDVELFGSTFQDTFAFKLENVADELKNLGKEGAKDFAHLSLLGLIGVDHMFNKVLSDIPAPFLRQLRESVGNKIHTAQTALHKELQGDETLFAKYHKQAATLVASGAVFSDDYVASLMHAPVTLLDKEPASETFTNTQFEIASSGLCLTKGGSNMMAEEDGYNACASSSAKNDYESYGASHDAQELSTVEAVHASGKNKGKPNGYVYIKTTGVGFGGNNCLFVDGKWQFDEVDFDGTIVEQERFHPSKYGSTPGFTWGCKTSPEYQWKILKHGEDYYQLHNRATQTCAWLQSTQDKYGDITNELAMVPCVGANTGVFRIAKPKAAVFHKVGLPLKNGYALWTGENQQDEVGDTPGAANPSEVGRCLTMYEPNNYGFNGGDQGSVFVSCDKPDVYDSNDWTKDKAGYDLFDYFVDDLGRRRFVSRTFPNTCLIGDVQLDNGGYGWGYTECDANSASQWLTTTETVGGLTLVNEANSGTIEDTKIKGGELFPDPMNILMMPLNPKAGITWQNNLGQNNGDALNMAYTTAQQATSAIRSWATTWSSIQSKLSSKTNDLAAGKQACIASGNKTYCYRLGTQTGYVGKPNTQSVGTVASMPVPGAPNPPPSTQVVHLPPVQLTDGTPIVVDDYGLAAKNQLPNLSFSAEPKWFACRTVVDPINRNEPPHMFVPGVVVNQYNCMFSEGSRKHNGDYRSDLLKSATDIFWQPAGKGYMPSSAVVTGRMDLNKSNGQFDPENLTYGYLTGQTMAMFTCRSMIGRQTRIGWTMGGKYCHILNGVGGAVVKNFEVLTTSYTQAAPPPPPPPPQPSCTFEMVQKYYANWQSVPGTCTKQKYNKEHPNCNFNSRMYGECGGGRPQNDPYGNDGSNGW